MPVGHPRAWETASAGPPAGPGTLGRMARWGGKKKSEGRGGRRRNYAPPPDQVGFRRYLPVGWVNWLGLAVFGLITVALLAETIAAILETRGTDPIAAGALTAGFAYMVYLFGTIRLRDE